MGNVVDDDDMDLLLLDEGDRSGLLELRLKLLFVGSESMLESSALSIPAASSSLQRE